MSFDAAVKKTFLKELYNKTEGDFDIQVSMYDIGQILGLEKDDIEEMVQELFIEGLAEMKTLSGGIGITKNGLETLDIKIAPVYESKDFQLGSNPILEDQGKTAVENILQEIKAGIDNKPIPFESMEEIIIDIKTIEIQMLSPNPKTQIIRETLKSLNQQNGFSDELKLKLQAMIS